jgi:hypothetical protein
MPVKDDYWFDIGYHISRGEPLAKNLCDDKSCERPHCEPVKLNGVSEPQNAGSGSTGRFWCFICDGACGKKHEDFLKFVKSMCGAFSEPMDYAYDYRLRLKVWQALIECGRDGQFKCGT